MDHITFESLPNEILWMIFSYLPVDDLTKQLGKTNKYFHSVITDTNFWKLRCMDLGLDTFKHINNLNWLMMSRHFGNLPSKIKIMIAGDFHTGKTAFVNSFLSDKKDAMTKGAVSKVSFTSNCELWILDSEPISTCGAAGETNDSTLIEVADVFICIYAVNAIYSLMYILNEFLPEVYRQRGKNVPVILVGSNKDDLGHKVREAKQNEVEQIAANKLKCSYIETCALKGTNVNEAFVLAVTAYIKKIREGRQEEPQDDGAEYKDMDDYEPSGSPVWKALMSYCSII